MTAPCDNRTPVRTLSVPRERGPGSLSPECKGLPRSGKKRHAAQAPGLCPSLFRCVAGPSVAVSHASVTATIPRTRLLSRPTPGDRRCLCLWLASCLLGARA